MSDYGDYDRDNDSYSRSSRDRRRSPHDDRDSHRSADRRNPKSGSKDLSSIGKKAAEKSGGLFSPEDWMCKSCGNINWARRSTCNMCNMPKYQKTEARTGAGGGYNERDNVEYNERHDESDGEYDEFGRKKKKYRGTLSNSDETSNDRMQNASKEKSRSMAEDKDKDEEDEEDEDDDDDFDAKKYALDSDDEEEQNNHQQASSSMSNKKTSSSGERRNSRSNSSSPDDRHSTDNRKSHRHDQPSSSNSHRRSNSPRSSKRTDDYHERRRSRSRSPISPSNRNYQKSSRH